MHKKELVKRIADRTSGTEGDPLTKNDIEDVIDAFCDTVAGALADGEKVQLIGFGTFSTTTTNPTNPQTGLKLGPRQTAKFKVADGLKERVKLGGEQVSGRFRWA